MAAFACFIWRVLLFRANVKKVVALRSSSKFARFHGVLSHYVVAVVRREAVQPLLEVIGPDLFVIRALYKIVFSHFYII